MLTTTKAQQRYLDAFAALYEAAEEMNAGDPMSYARSREINRLKDFSQGISRSCFIGNFLFF